MVALTALSVVVVLGVVAMGVAATARPTHCGARARTISLPLKRVAARLLWPVAGRQELDRPGVIDGALIPTESGPESVEEEVLAGRRRVAPGQHLTTSQEEN